MREDEGGGLGSDDGAGGRYIVLKTDAYAAWVEGLRDREAAARIDKAARRMQQGQFGDWRHVGDGVRELRLHFGPGYRLYYAHTQRVVVVLLVGGDKGSQVRSTPSRGTDCPCGPQGNRESPANASPIDAHYAASRREPIATMAHLQLVACSGAYDQHVCHTAPVRAPGP